MLNRILLSVNEVLTCLWLQIGSHRYAQRWEWSQISRQPLDYCSRLRIQFFGSEKWQPLDPWHRQLFHRTKLTSKIKSHMVQSFSIDHIATRLKTSQVGFSSIDPFELLQTLFFNSDCLWCLLIICSGNLIVCWFLSFSGDLSLSICVGLHWDSCILGLSCVCISGE